MMPSESSLRGTAYEDHYRQQLKAVIHMGYNAILSNPQGARGMVDNIAEDCLILAKDMTRDSLALQRNTFLKET